MDIFLAKLTQQAMNYAIRSGITITSTYAVRQCGRFLKTVDDQDDFDEIYDLQARLDSKIKIVSPAIDMIELIAARGNTSLESAVSLTKSLRWEIQSLGTRLARAAAAYESTRGQASRNKQRPSHDAEVRSVVKDMKRLLNRIEDAVPLINLAITTSGVSLSTTLPATISPSRMLQASTFLTAGDNNYQANPSRPSQVGPTFTLSLYMLFAGHARPHDERALQEMTWKETIHKAQVKLMRIPLATAHNGTYQNNSELIMNSIEADSLTHFSADNQANEYAYELVIIEDLDDDRVHTFEDGEPRPSEYEGVRLAGFREHLPVHQISKIFYADTGKILNIGSDGESNNPILLLKRDVNAKPPASKMDESGREEPWQFEEAEHGDDSFIGEDQQDSYTDESEDGSEDPNDQLHRESSFIPDGPPSRTPSRTPEVPQVDRCGLPPNLDPEWFAFEVFEEAQDEEDEDDSSSSDSEDTAAGPRDSAYVSAQQTPSADDIAANLSHLNLSSPSASASSTPTKQRARRRPILKQPTNDLFGPVRSSLSLLEMLIRLTVLQQFEQKSHLSIPDEILTFFLQESSTTGKNGEERRQMRYEAKMKVGFDPYYDSPVKHHEEVFQRGSPARSRRGESAFEGQDESLPLPGRIYRSRSSTPISPRVDDEWLMRDAHKHREKTRSSDVGPGGSPASPLPRRLTRPVDRIKLKSKGMASPSPLGMNSGVAVGIDSRLGTSPASAGSGKGAGTSRSPRSGNEEVVIKTENATP